MKRKMTPDRLDCMQREMEAKWCYTQKAIGLELLAEIRRLTAEVERLKREVEKANKAIEMLGGHPLTQEGR